ncbi:hypothetical protein OPQ81_001790 [Rhizoctonia solani]|nr:hypothetical protein OPQ81_001790 [Rhizoctonia solani]
MSRSCFKGRWVPWHSQPEKVPTDALANWAAKARAEVEWETALIHQADNTAIHFATPKLTCVKCHPLMDAYGATISYEFTDRSQVKLVCERLIEDWERRYRGYYRLIDYEPRIGGYGPSYTLSIMICYRMEQCLIPDCVGQGSRLREAKSVAAQKLLESGHCMIHL